MPPQKKGAPSFTINPVWCPPGGIAADTFAEALKRNKNYVGKGRKFVTLRADAMRRELLDNPKQQSLLHSLVSEINQKFMTLPNQDSPVQQATSIGQMTEIRKNPATLLTVDERSEGQRIDNFLARHLKGVPKSHIYRILRSGEVRVDGRRVDAAQRLHAGAVLRIPPVRVAQPTIRPSGGPVQPRLAKAVIHEDDALLALDKPAGMAVHGGSGISRGVIEQLRLERPQARFLELVHRLDRETSGVLLIGKKRSALTRLHDMLRENRMRKRYLMLVKGIWRDQRRRVVLPLVKHDLQSGEKRVTVEEGGQRSETVFHLREQLGEFSFLEAELVTGRTHQLRVQLAHLGFPILGDDKYGDFALNRTLQKQGLKRMFLHSAQTLLQHPLTGEPLDLRAPLPEDLSRFLQALRSRHAQAV